LCFEFALLARNISEKIPPEDIEKRPRVAERLPWSTLVVRRQHLVRFLTGRGTFVVFLRQATGQEELTFSFTNIFPRAFESKEIFTPLLQG
jgi:hypothetical protein